MAEPWSAEHIGGGKFRFSNTSGRKLVAVTLTPTDGAKARVIDGVPDDPWVVPRPVEAGSHFEAFVEGAVRVTATIPETFGSVYWDYVAQA